jgi:hypothetical protein
MPFYRVTTQWFQHNENFYVLRFVHLQAYSYWFGKVAVLVTSTAAACRPPCLDDIGCCHPLGFKVMPGVHLDKPEKYSYWPAHLPINNSSLTHTTDTPPKLGGLPTAHYGRHTTARYW